MNQVLEAARRAGFLGSGLEARVLLHVEQADLAAGLQRLQQVRQFLQLYLQANSLCRRVTRPACRLATARTRCATSL